MAILAISSDWNVPKSLQWSESWTLFNQNPRAAFRRHFSEWGLPFQQNYWVRSTVPTEVLCFDWRSFYFSPLSDFRLFPPCSCERVLQSGLLRSAGQAQVFGVSPDWLLGRPHSADHTNRWHTVERYRDARYWKITLRADNLIHNKKKSKLN